ncbi:hypothetical protein GCM10027035_05150 [Emticicia sediminis]
MPTTAVIFVSLTITKEAAATPPNETAVTPVNFVPLIVISVPVGPDVGVNEAMLGLMTGGGGGGVASVLLHLNVKKGKAIVIKKNMIFLRNLKYLISPWYIVYMMLLSVNYY